MTGQGVKIGTNYNQFALNTPLYNKIYERNKQNVEVSL